MGKGEASLLGEGGRGAQGYQAGQHLHSECTCEQLTGTSASYACLEEHDHECKPSPHRHTSASTSGEKAEQAARADCGSTGGRTRCARSKGAANVFTIPLDDERETASTGGLAGATPTAPGVLSIAESATITGGTGRFADATGTFTVERLFNQVTPLTTGSFQGTISSPGAGTP